MNAGEAGELLRARKASSVELTTAALARIDRYNPEWRAFLTVTGERALEQARRADDELAAGKDRGPLHGIPVAVKDLFLTRGVTTTGGSRIYENFVPDHDAAVVEKLAGGRRRDAGQAQHARTGLRDHVREPTLRRGTQPLERAAFAGGIQRRVGRGRRRPDGVCGDGQRYRRVDPHPGGILRGHRAQADLRAGQPVRSAAARPGAWTTWVRWRARCATRRWRSTPLWDAMPATRPSSRRPPVDFVPDAECSIRGVRVGFPENFYFDRLDPDVESGVRGAIARAGALGASVRPVWLPDIDAINAVARVILLAEASAVYTPHLERRELFGGDVLALLDQGRLVPAVDYVNAQRLRRSLRREFEGVWREVDCLLVPTTPAPAPEIGETTVRLGGSEEDVRLAATRLVRAINALGLPALSMPCGLTGAGLPVGLQIVGPAFAEALVLQVGAALEDNGVGIPPCPLA